ncbi:hypothetical protein O3M35_012210 [Rhynocoris fuscipes]|uniref:Glutaredoxin-3 n=1 Tax=Rhynocoris fuscipes TaxID=488301 RepID=A0AAW1CZK0_9HEMI
MTVLSLATKEEFELMIKNHPLCVVHFYADWVDQCQHMDKIIREMAALPEYEVAKFIRLPAEDVPEMSHKYKVTAVPTFVLMSYGKALDYVKGANPGELVNKVKTQINSIKVRNETVAVEPVKFESLQDRIKKLINIAPVTLFMKGDASHPKCGFSRQIIEILDNFKVDYKTFDILTDNEIREGLKKFSNWPTYPQLYIYGELIGGLDIVKELVANGEFEEKLPKKQCIQDRLHALINKHKVMAFIKGTNEKPKCGFTKKLLDILNKTNIPFETFDITTDEEVRQGLKKYSNWPTYPQVYVNGELIGGLDVVEELDKTGHLITTLNPTLNV